MLGKFTLTEIATKYRVTRRTLDNWFAPFREQDITPHSVNHSDAVLIIDGYYVEFGAVILIAQTTTNQVISWSFTYRENYTNWLAFFEQINLFPFSVVCDGQKGMIKAIKQRWPGMIIQRCQFHVIHHVNILLTRNPETLAAQEFKMLAGSISQVKTKDNLKEWLVNYKAWYQQYQYFLKHKTYQDNQTPTGRKKWHYTHGHLHAAHSHLKNAFPYLFQYLKYPNIPNTSNRIEGGINSQIQRYVDRHRGTKLFQRRQIIAAFLKQKQLQKPTRNFT